MESFKIFAYSLASFVGLGVLLLPFFVTKLGTANFFLAFFAISALFFAINNIFFDIFSHHSSIQEAVEERVKALYFLYPIGIFLFSSGALTAYVLGFGQYASHVFGGLQQYWSTFFFLLALILILLGPKTVIAFSSVSSIFLSLVLLALIPVGLSRSEPLPFTGNLAFLPLFLMVGFFAFFGQFSIGDILKFSENKKQVEKQITYAFLTTVALYLVYALSMAALSKEFELSLLAVSDRIGGYLSVLAFIAAFLAFITPFLPITEMFVGTMREWGIKRNSALVLLFFPVAVLYTAAREMRFPLLHIAGGISGSGIAILIFLAALAHYSLTKEYETKVPRWISAFIAVIVPIILLSYILTI